jgi:hypothetical protein
MKKISILTFSIMLFFSNCLFSQTVAYSNWAIGNGGGLKFQNGNLTQFQSQMACQDMGSTISDAIGNLLFYCNGTTVYNKNHTVMANGTGLLGDVTGGHAALILQQSETSFFYIFTIDKYADNDGLRYHIVDMSANSGLGQVITKNVILLNPASEKIAAVWNSNQNCYKIITHKWGNNEFHVFELNNAGLNTTPVISAVGPDHQNGIYGQAHDALGQMSISPNGSKVALALCYSAIYQLYDFDINTGVLSNPVSFGNYPFAWGIDFSPNSLYVYFTQWTQHKVYQADISSGVSSAIDASIVDVGTVPGAGQYSVGYVSRTPDGRIFIAKYGYNDLATISEPDLAGAACNYNDAGLVLQYGSSTAGLSTYPVFPANTNGLEDIAENSIQVFPNPNNGSFTVLKNKLNQASRLFIYNVDGAMVFSSDLNESSLTETFHLDLSAGVYFIKVTGPKSDLLNQKLVILDK